MLQFRPKALTWIKPASLGFRFVTARASRRHHPGRRLSPGADDATGRAGRGQQLTSARAPKQTAMNLVFANGDPQARIMNAVAHRVLHILHAWKGRLFERNAQGAPARRFARAAQETGFRPESALR